MYDIINQLLQIKSRFKHSRFDPIFQLIFGSDSPVIKLTDYGFDFDR